ncbi:MAG: hypothetical protein IT165_04760 [Bryobacterales bacterium]|nr:hypothetical protein [Bryobacterales bacterium]
MAIYTCLDMIRDCRANRPEGWSYLVTTYVPVIRRLLAHYYANRWADAELIHRVLKALRNPQSPLFAAPGAGTEREFVAMLRQEVLRLVEADQPSGKAEVDLDLETLSSALEPFTVTEKQLVWFESMAYNAEATALLMNLEVSTVQKARDRAEEALRGALDRWRRGLMGDNGLALGRLALAGRTADCLSSKAYLEIIDGRITWARKKDYDFHVVRCWHCVDFFCRIRESDFALRQTRPLTAEEARPLCELLGLPAEKKSLWQRVLGG